MKRILILAVIILASHMMIASAENTGVGSSQSMRFSPIQIAAYHPYQLFDENVNIYGLGLNIFYGINQDVYGIDIGTFNKCDNMGGFEVALAATLNEGRGTSLQFAGFVNYVDEGFTGLQVAGLFNYTEHNMTGLQVSGLCNLVYEGNVTALQIAGLGNVVQKGSAGYLQAAGFFNYIGQGDFTGIQLGGVANGVTGNFTGIQLSLMNSNSADSTGIQLGLIYNKSGRDVYGTQIGVINVADRVKGVQIGIINMARRMNGVQIGVANIIIEGGMPFLPIVNFSSSF